MRALIQRVSQASVCVDNRRICEIGPGLLLCLALQRGDEQARANKLLNKILGYRIFADQHGRMNLSLQQVGGGLLIISQFTLAADTSKGLRPGFSSAAEPEHGKQLYDYFVQRAREAYPKKVATGCFGADMKVSLLNDGPVTFLLDA